MNTPARSVQVAGRDVFVFDGLVGIEESARYFNAISRASFTRTELASHLDQKKIGNRMLFGGNLVRQPAFVQLKRDRPDAFRVVGDLAGTDRLMNDAVFIGTYPGLTGAMLDYVIGVVHEFVRKR